MIRGITAQVAIPQGFAAVDALKNQHTFDLAISMTDKSLDPNEILDELLYRLGARNVNGTLVLVHVDGAWRTTSSWNVKKDSPGVGGFAELDPLVHDGEIIGYWWGDGVVPLPEYGDVARSYVDLVADGPEDLQEFAGALADAVKEWRLRRELRDSFGTGYRC